jgi:hypothetical protein
MAVGLNMGGSQRSTANDDLDVTYWFMLFFLHFCGWKKDTSHHHSTFVNFRIKEIKKLI